MIKNVSIILTATVHIQNKSCLFQLNKQERINIYEKSIKQWLEKTNFNIIVVENSGHRFSNLNNFLEKYKDRFEIISFNEKNIKEAEYLKNNNSKGASEIFAINYAYNNSKIINKSLFIIKITCRYFIPELENYLSNYDINNFNALTQNNINRCEIVGSHINNFHIIFNKYLINENGKYEGHVENIYKYRINNLFKNVIRCKQFSIEPTQRGGKNEKYNNL